MSCEAGAPGPVRPSRSTEPSALSPASRSMGRTAHALPQYEPSAITALVNHFACLPMLPSHCGAECRPAPDRDQSPNCNRRVLLHWSLRHCRDLCGRCRTGLPWTSHSPTSAYGRVRVATNGCFVDAQPVKRRSARSAASGKTDGRLWVGSGCLSRALEGALFRIELMFTWPGSFGAAAADFLRSPSTDHLGGGIESETLALWIWNTKTGYAQWQPSYPQLLLGNLAPEWRLARCSEHSGRCLGIGRCLRSEPPGHTNH